MDIGSNNKFPAGTLSNFTANYFTFDGVECKSMEGLLQSFKFENDNSQKATCLLTGFKAKSKGKNRNKQWKRRQVLWWNGEEFDRSSKEYQWLLNRAFLSLFRQSVKFRSALTASGNSVFTHSIGNSNKRETVLTEREFCSRLQYLKDELLNRE